MSRRLEEYHCDAMLYRGEHSTLDREVEKTSVDYWDTDNEIDGTRDHWRVTFWGKPDAGWSGVEVKGLQLMASALFPFDAVLVLGEREA